MYEISRQSIYYHTSIYSEAFLKRQEEINLELLKQAGIEPSGYYHYDEQFPFEEETISPFIINRRFKQLSHKMT